MCALAGVSRLEPAPRLSRVVKFGLFEVNLEGAELRKSGMRQKLVGQPFEVLRVLLERPQELVTREELQQRIWPKDTFVDYDLALKKAVNRIRDVLGDSADSPRFIETVPRQGYRFIGNIERDFSAQASIAVLPFINISADPENEFFADGITEEIINVLSQIDGLHVAARTSSFFFKGKHAEMRQIGEQLNVRTALEGSVRKIGDRLRITAQLVNVADGYHLWSERYDRELKDVFAIQDEIARSIAERLKLTLEGEGAEQLVKSGTTNLEAYQLYLKGRTLLYRRGIGIPAAVECFERAVLLDPEYAPAWAGIADAYTTVGYNGLVHPKACMLKGIEAARRAVRLDASLAEAHTALAMAALVGAWDKEEAEREFLRALELNPRYVQARGWYAFFYLVFSEGRLAEGVAQARLALEFDPLSSYAHAVYGNACACAGEYAQAIPACRRAVELDSDSYIARLTLAIALYASGKFEESIATTELALTMSGRHSWAMATLAVIFADCGKAEDADAVYAELAARARRQYVPPSMLAAAASGACREHEAICHAREAMTIHDPACVFFSKHWPLCARLYAYPRFRDLLSEVGFE
jgi:adenylate cyclase